MRSSNTSPVRRSTTSGEAFQDEFRRICRKYGVEIDERYVWD
jgi:hypothetical protein